MGKALIIGAGGAHRAEQRRNPDAVRLSELWRGQAERGRTPE